VTVIQVPVPQLAGSVDEAREALAEVVSAVDELAATVAG
jgi:hypothetical protein